MRKTRNSIGIFTLIILIIGLVAGRPTKVGAFDVDDLLDAHPLGPFDEVACNGATEDQLDTGDPAQDFFPPFEFGTSESHNDSGGQFSGQYDFPFSDDEVFQLFNRRSDENSEPRVNISISPTEIQQGQDVTLTASVSDYRDQGSTQDMEFAVSFAVDDKSLQGIQAGGKKLPEGSGGPCGLVTRTPEVDEDRDGMDDNWELAYGLNPNNPGDAFLDPDNDSFSKFFTNQLDEVLEITPETLGGPTGVMNNLAEYVYDTDPNRSDTDGDGIIDGEEIVGFGGNTVQFVNDRPVGSAVQVRAYVVGLSSMEDAFNEFENIVKLDSATKTFFVSNGEHLEGQAEPVDDFTEPGESTVIEANFVGSPAEPDSFAYSYEVDGEEVSNPSSAKHRLAVTVDPERTPGSQIPYKIEAINPNTGQLATMRGVIQVGETITLESDPVEPPANGPVTVHAVLASGADPNDYLYEWTVDGQSQERDSGVGRDSIALTAPSASGDSMDVALRLFLADSSKKVGEALLQVVTAKPIVELELIPEQPSPEDLVTAFARPHGFPVNYDSDSNGDNDATLLSYTWEIDGSEQPADENVAGFSRVTFPAGKQDDEHTIKVSVHSVGPQSESAKAELSFATGVVGSTIIARLGTSASSLAASLRDAAPQLSVAAAGVVGVGLLLGFIYRRGRST